MSDYIDLSPDDVIRKGDEYASISGKRWFSFVYSIGKTLENRHWVEFGSPDIKARRPRSTVILDALLRVREDLMREYSPHVYKANFGYIDEAIGNSIEELRDGK